MLIAPKSLLLLAIYATIGDAELEIDDESCETLQSEVHITKEENDEIGHLRRTCSSDVTVTKCEGFCNSQVQPSVVTTTGFAKVSSLNQNYFHILYIYLFTIGVLLLP